MASAMIQNLAPKAMGLGSTNTITQGDGQQHNKSKLDPPNGLSSSQILSEGLRHSYPKPTQHIGSQGKSTTVESMGTNTIAGNSVSSATLLKGLSPEAATVVKKLNSQNLVGQSPHLKARVAEATVPHGHPNIHQQQTMDSGVIGDLEKSFQSGKMRDVGLTRTVALSQEYKPRVAQKGKIHSLTGMYSLANESQSTKAPSVPQPSSSSLVASANRQSHFGSIQYSVISHLVGQLQQTQANNQVKSPGKSNTISMISPPDKDAREKEFSTGTLRKGSGHKLRAPMNASVGEGSLKVQSQFPHLGMSAKETKLFTQLNPRSNALMGNSINMNHRGHVLPNVNGVVKQMDTKQTVGEHQDQMAVGISTKKIVKKELIQSPKEQDAEGLRGMLQMSSNSPQQILVAINPRNRGANTSEGVGGGTSPGRAGVRRVNRHRPLVLTKADKKCNILFNLFCNVFPSTKPTLVKCGIGSGNNDKLIEKLLRAKGLATETFFSKCNFIWTQGINKRTAMAKSGAGFVEMDLRSDKTPENIRMYKIKSAEALSQQIQTSKLFYVSPQNIHLLREACEKAKAAARLFVINPEEFTLMNHMKGLKYITRKHLLYHTMKEYCDQQKLAVGDFVPETWVLRGDTFEADLDILLKEKVAKNDNFKDPLIVKPGENSNRGQGIEMAFNVEEVKLLTAFLLESRKNTSTVVVQTYISNPMLFAKRKFDIRCYALVVRSPYKISFFWYSQGYARTCSFEYSPACRENLMVHLTNEAVQVKDPKNFGKFEPGNKVYYDQLDQYFSTCEEFQSRGKEFIRDIVPKFKVCACLTLGTGTRCFQGMCI